MLAFTVILLVVLLLFSAFISMSEVALFSLSSSKIRAFRLSQDRRKNLVAKLLASPRDFLITIIVLNVGSSILIQNVTSSLFGVLPGWKLSVGVPLVLTLVFGEVLPKSIGLTLNEKMAHRSSRILACLQALVTPFRIFLTAVTTYLSRIMFFYLHQDREISVQELQHALTTSSVSGTVQEDEAELLRGYLDLQEAQVKLLMRPREEVLFFDIDKPLAELIALFVDKQCSRVPVCKGSLDHVIGIATSLDVFMHRSKITTSFDLKPHLLPPTFIPESTPAMMLLKQMYTHRESLALVVDEYGMVSGIISQEDLIERVVGEISDARDVRRRYTRSSSDEVIASGKLELAEFADIFGSHLHSNHHMVTLGGWLCEQIGDIPKIGTKYVYGDFLFHILSVDPTRIRRVYIRHLHTGGVSDE